MTEKVLGFKYPQKYTQKQKTGEGDTVYCVAGKNLVPVVSLEKHQKERLKLLKEADYWRTMYEGCKKRLTEAKIRAGEKKE